MLGSTYERTTPVSTADLAAIKETDMFDMLSTVNAIRTLTLWKSRERDRFFVANRSLYLGVMALHADDLAFYGSKLVLPGQIAEFASDDFGNWYRVGSNTNVSVISFSVSSANFLALNTTILTLIQAPGAGRVISVTDILMQMTRTGTAYANGGALEFRYTDASGAKVTADIAAALVTTGGAGVAYAAVGGIEASITPVPNASIRLGANGADFITGTGTAKLSIQYRVDDFS